MRIQEAKLATTLSDTQIASSHLNYHSASNDVHHIAKMNKKVQLAGCVPCPSKPLPLALLGKAITHLYWSISCQTIHDGKAGDPALSPVLSCTKLVPGRAPHNWLLCVAQIVVAFRHWEQHQCNLVGHILCLSSIPQQQNSPEGVSYQRYMRLDVASTSISIK